MSRCIAFGGDHNAYPYTWSLEGEQVQPQHVIQPQQSHVASQRDNSDFDLVLTYNLALETIGNKRQENCACKSVSYPFE